MTQSTAADWQRHYAAENQDIGQEWSLTTQTGK